MADQALEALVGACAVVEEGAAMLELREVSVEIGREAGADEEPV